MKKFLYGAAALSLALAFTGCDDDDDPIGGNGDDGCLLDAECGGYICDLSNPDEDGNGVCLDNCVIGEDQCAEGYECSEAGVCEFDDIEVVEGYNQVLIVSRTPMIANPEPNEGDCRAGNPGPDIDYVRAESGGEIVPAIGVSGDHGDYCGSAEMGTEQYPWAEPGVVLENTSIGFNEAGEEEPGYCAVDNASEKYFFMGTGQPYAVDEVILADTGYLLVQLDAALEDGDLVEVGEVGIEPGADGEGQTCEDGPQIARPGDQYGIYLVHSDVTSVGVDTVLEAPNFILVEESVIGLTKSTVILD